MQDIAGMPNPININRQFFPKIKLKIKLKAPKMKTISAQSEPSKKDEIEQWKEILPEYPGYYISSLGRIKNKHKKILNPGISADGYLKPKLVNKDGKKIATIVHVLVAKIFIPNPENKPYVDHINRVRHDNRVDNLRWATPSENSKNRNSSNKTGSRKVIQMDLNNNIIKIWKSTMDAMRSLNLKSNNISDVCLGKAKTCAGFKWKYFDEERDEENEQWKEILPDFPGYYISSHGRIKNKFKRMLNPGIESSGYINPVLMNKDGKKIKLRLHILVAKIFIPNPENKPIVDHINRVKHDNRVDNLRWATPSENCKNRDISNRPRGGRKVNQYNMEGEFIASFSNILEAEKKTGVNRCGIGYTCRGDQQSSGNFIWEYADQE